MQSIRQSAKKLIRQNVTWQREIRNSLIVGQFFLICGRRGGQQVIKRWIPLRYDLILKNEGIKVPTQTKTIRKNLGMANYWNLPQGNKNAPHYSPQME